MTPTRRALDSIEPLTLDNRVGNGSPAMADLIRVQTAILTSNAALLGTVTEFRKGIDQRLTRQFGEVAKQIDGVGKQLDAVSAAVVVIKDERREEAIRAQERTTNAKAAAADAKDADAVAVQHTLSKNQRMAVMVAAVSGCGGLALTIVTLLLRVAGVLS